MVDARQKSLKLVVQKLEIHQGKLGGEEKSTASPRGQDKSCVLTDFAQRRNTRLNQHNSDSHTSNHGKHAHAA